MRELRNFTWWLASAGILSLFGCAEEDLGPTDVACGGGCMSTLSGPCDPGPDPWCGLYPDPGSGYGCQINDIHGVPVYNNDGGWGTEECGKYQCVELVKRYHGLNQSIGNGGQVCDNAPSFGFDRYYNGSSAAPQPGDIIGFEKPGTVGHVALVDSVDLAGGWLHIAEQNWPNDGKAQITISSGNGGYFIGNHGGYSPECWARNPNGNPHPGDPEYVETDYFVSMMVAYSGPDHFKVHADSFEEGVQTAMTPFCYLDGAPDPVINNDGSVSNAKRWRAADFDGDAYTDLMLITHASGRLKAFIWYSNGNGTFSGCHGNAYDDNCKDKVVDYGKTADFHLVGDVGSVSGPADGKADLVLGFIEDSNTVRWRVALSQGRGNDFKSPQTWKSDFGNSDWDYDLADVTGNAKADLIGWNVKTGDTKYTWRVSASVSGSFYDNNIWKNDWGVPGSHFVFTDWDNDGDADLVNIKHYDDDSEAVMVAKADGNKDGGSFNYGGSHWFDGQFGKKDDIRYDAADLNWDGRNDLVLYNQSGMKVKVLYNTGGGPAGPYEPIAGVATGSKGAVRFGRFGVYTHMQEYPDYGGDDDDPDVSDDDDSDPDDDDSTPAGDDDVSDDDSQDGYCGASVTVSASDWWYGDEHFYSSGSATKYVACGNWIFLAVNGTASDLTWTDGTMHWENGGASCSTDASWDACGYVEPPGQPTGDDDTGDDDVSDDDDSTPAGDDDSGPGACQWTGSLTSPPAWIYDTYYSNPDSVQIEYDPALWIWIGCQTPYCFAPDVGHLTSASCDNGWTHCYWWVNDDC